MPHLYIIRGLPGSGKSTFAVTLYDHETFHFEADDYFVLNGEYQYDRRLIGAAHDWCFSKTVLQLRRGNDVIVSNTFTQMWELERYLSIPTILDNITMAVIEMRTQYQNIHGVPEDVLERMAGRWESIPQEWINDGLFVKYIGESDE